MGIFGFIVGILLCAVIVFKLMPSMMIVTRECKLNFDETIAALEERIPQNGWSIKEIKNLNDELNEAGIGFKPRTKLIKLCKAEYAKSVLSSDRYISCLMPCTISVWEDDDGKVYLSKMNVALMAKMFGGNIAKVMGKEVGRDERIMIKGLLKK